MIVVSDTSPINYLLQIGHIELLPQIYGRVLIPREVLDELREARDMPVLRDFLRALPEWIIEQNPVKLIPDLELDVGETAAISLASEIKAELLLIDERRGAERARSLGLHVTGTLGVLLEASRRGILPISTSVKQLIEQTNFRISAELLDQVLNAGF